MEVVSARFYGSGSRSGAGSAVQDVPFSLADVEHLGNPFENEKVASAEYREGKTVLRSLPPIVTYALTTHCYSGKDICLICDRNTRPASADSSATEEAIRAVTPLLNTATHVFLHCGGEAMFSPYFDDVISMINPPTRALFATNGMAMTARRADHMLERDVMGEIMVSMDAATPEMLRIMRPACDFETLSKNIAYYTKKARELGREAVSSLVLGMTVCETNLRDVPALVDLAEKLGARFVEYNHLNVGLNHKIKTVDGWDWDYVEQARFTDPVLHDNLLMEAYQRAKAKDIKVVFIGQPFIGPNKDDFDQAIKSDMGIHFNAAPDPKSENPWVSRHHPVYAPGVPACVKPWREVVIQPTGVVRACYFHDENAFAVGNIVKTNFMEIWNSPAMIQHREQFLSKGVSNMCLASHPCMFRGRQ